MQGCVLLCFGIVLLGVDNAYSHYAMRFNFVCSRPLSMLSVLSLTVELKLNKGEFFNVPTKPVKRPPIPPSTMSLLTAGALTSSLLLQPKLMLFLFSVLFTFLIAFIANISLFFNLLFFVFQCLSNTLSLYSHYVPKKFICQPLCKKFLLSGSTRVLGIF